MSPHSLRHKHQEVRIQVGVWNRVLTEEVVVIQEQFDRSCHGPYTDSVYTRSAGQHLQLLCLGARLKRHSDNEVGKSLGEVPQFENWNGRRIQTFHDAWAKEHTVKTK